MKNLEVWDRLKTPPEWAKKEIQAGRLKGKTDINPQWRYKAMTEAFGVCGFGWRFEIIKLSLETGKENEVRAFAEINLYVKIGDQWSNKIPGIGGSSFVTIEKNGVFVTDECFKMAVTDALSVAMKMLGVGADVYQGFQDTKYNDIEKPEQKQEPTKPVPKLNVKKDIDPYNQTAINQINFWIESKLYNPKNLDADIRLALNELHITEKIKMSHMTHEQVDAVLRIIRKEVKTKDPLEGTDFNSEPVIPDLDENDNNNPGSPYYKQGE